MLDSDYSLPTVSVSSAQSCGHLITLVLMINIYMQLYSPNNGSKNKKKEDDE